MAYRRVDRAFAQVAIRRWYNYIPVGLQVDCQLIFSLQDHIDQSHFARMTCQCDLAGKLNSGDKQLNLLYPLDRVKIY